MEQPTKQVFWVDVPNSNNPTVEWVNVGKFQSSEAALQYIRENIDPTTKDGSVQLISIGYES